MPVFFSTAGRASLLRTALNGPFFFLQTGIGHSFGHDFLNLQTPKMPCDVFPSGKVYVNGRRVREFRRERDFSGDILLGREYP